MASTTPQVNAQHEAPAPWEIKELPTYLQRQLFTLELEGFPHFLRVVFTSRPPLAYINQPKATTMNTMARQLEGNTEGHAQGDSITAQERCEGEGPPVHSE
jgi:hypothetical protein